MTLHNHHVRNYYDQNTRLFLAFHRSDKAENIHRALWADNIQTLEEALHVTNERIRAEIEAVAPVHARIADLGFGVGAGLITLPGVSMNPISRLGSRSVLCKRSWPDSFAGTRDWTTRSSLQKATSPLSP